MRQEKRTGTLFAVTANNLIAQISLNQGEIVSLVFQSKQGLEGLALLQQQDIPIKVSRFVEGQVLKSQTDLPLTDLILEQLDDTQSLPAWVMDQSADKALTLTAQAKAVLEQELIEFMGPIAPIICQETWALTNDLETALITLGRELANPGQVARFRQNVLKKLQLQL
ncbi:MAG: hypothetical protein U1F42_08555 [Candidatus Competibacteraceae bacterium]